MKCPNCGNESEFTWAWSPAVAPGIAVNRLSAHDVSVEFYLGCDVCSETVAFASCDQVAEILNIVNWSGAVVRGESTAPAPSSPPFVMPTDPAQYLASLQAEYERGWQARGRLWQDSLQKARDDGFAEGQTSLVVPPPTDPGAAASAELAKIQPRFNWTTPPPT